MKRQKHLPSQSSAIKGHEFFGCPPNSRISLHNVNGKRLKDRVKKVNRYVHRERELIHFSDSSYACLIINQSEGLAYHYVLSFLQMNVGKDFCFVGEGKSNYHFHNQPNKKPANLVNYHLFV